MKNFTKSEKIDAIRNSILSSFLGLSFDAELHKYTVNGMVLTSVTTNLKNLTDSFNSYFASEAKGKKMLKLDPNDKRTGLYYRKRWDHIRNEATEMGNRVHLFAETAPRFDSPIDWREQAVMDFYEWLPAKYEVVELELRVYDIDTYHAGTIDGILYNTETGKLVIFDWKTNKRNINELYKNTNLKGKFKDIKATSLNKYALQLSDYSFVIEKKTGMEVEEHWVVWIRDTDHNIKDVDRSKDYKINKVKPFLDADKFNIYKTKRYNDRLIDYYDSIKTGLKDKATPQKIKPGTFKKKGRTVKKKGLFSKK